MVNRLHIIRRSALVMGLALVIASGWQGRLLAQIPGQQSVPEKVFDTPEAAVKALRSAVGSNNNQLLLEIFGTEFAEYIDTADKAREEVRREEFAQLMDEYTELYPVDENTRTLFCGLSRWPFPIPLIKAENGWRFETAAGIIEIVDRRIGENELAAISGCLYFVTAQVEYAGKDRDGDEVLEYAQRILSNPGLRDGLYWRVDQASGEEPSPFAPLMVKAATLVKSHTSGDPFMGYYFKVLTRQGENPPGGKYDYVINGNMIAGFALVAWPAEYGNSGIMTFVVSHQGHVFEKDLGDKTAELVANMTEYNPDDTWRRWE